jgi:surfeit locus 1 family protein
VTVSDSTAPSIRRRWRPSLFSVVLTAVGMALFARLGFWQLDRAEQKQELLAEYEVGQRTQLVITSENADKLARYQRVSIAGRYDPGHQILLDNMPSHAGQPGFRVLTPMQSPAGWLLVDRGWLPLGATRAELPNVAVSAADRNITGTLDSLPRAGITLKGVPIAADAPWPRVLSFPTQADLEQHLGHKLLPGVLLLDPSQPDGYERIWEAHLGFKPERHIGYAVQWFALAAAAAVIFVLMGFRTKKATDERPH